MKSIIVLVLAALAFVPSTPIPASSLLGSTIHFGPDSKFSGYFVKPTGRGPFPGLIMIHEWWGLNENVMKVADQLSHDGYVVLAVDLFGKSTMDPKESLRMVRSLDQVSAIAQMLSAGDYLRSRGYVRPDRVGSIGWCFGGGQALKLALNDPKLAAAVIYYGQLETYPKDLRNIRAPVLGIFGEADTSIPMTQVQDFRKGLQMAGVTNEIYTYPGANHAFASPTRSERYRPDDAADAWKKTAAFLAKYLK